MSRDVFGRNTKPTEENPYVVATSMEVDWSNGKSCDETRTARLGKQLTAKPKAMIRGYGQATVK